MSKYAFRWTVAILVTIMLSLLSVIGKQSPEQRAKQTQPQRPQVAQKLSPLEECANLALIVDRSLSVQQAFGICETGKPVETWLAIRSNNRDNRR